MLVRALLRKTLVFAVRISPFKKCTIELFIRLAAFRILLSRKRCSWRQIATFAEINGVANTGWRYAYRYFVEQARYGVWSHLYYELPEWFDQYVSIEGLVELQEATRRGRGAVLVGAHFGPSIATSLLRQAGIDVRPVVANQLLLRGPNAPRYFRRLLASRRRTFRSEMQSFQAKTSERDLVRFVRQGGVVSMLIDYPRPEAGGTPISLFGNPFRLYYFPFKLAQKYEVPVFFYFFGSTQRGGYLLRLIPAGNISTPDLGVIEYGHRLEEHIRMHPYAPTNFIRRFMESN